MPAQKTNLEELIRKTAYLFSKYGYHNTSIFDIAKFCGLSKASVYHYMSSKEALGCAVIQYAHREVREAIFRHAYTALSEKERLMNFSDALKNFFCEREGGCLLGNLALEVTGVIPEFERLIRVYFEEWAEALKLLFKPKYGEEKAIELAQDVIAQTQGAVMMLRLFKDRGHLERVVERLKTLL